MLSEKKQMVMADLNRAKAEFEDIKKTFEESNYPNPIKVAVVKQCNVEIHERDRLLLETEPTMFSDTAI